MDSEAGWRLLVMAPAWEDPRAGGDAQPAAWAEVSNARGLAFDHGRILADGLERACAKLEYSALALAFMPSTFTMA
jgi:8-oxo-dGTP diphosphatase